MKFFAVLNLVCKLAKQQVTLILLLNVSWPSQFVNIFKINRRG